MFMNVNLLSNFITNDSKMFSMQFCMQYGHPNVTVRNYKAN